MARIQSFNQYKVTPSPDGYELVAVGAIVKSLNKPSVSLLQKIPTNACTIRVVANTASVAGSPCVIYTLNGETPSATTGMPLFNGDVMELYLKEVDLAQFVSADVNTHVIFVEYARVS